MIMIKDRAAMRKMEEAGRLLASIFARMGERIIPGITSAELDRWIAERLTACDMVSKTKGYMGYKHVSCISVNEEVVHGVPSLARVFQGGDLIKVDVCASWRGYCADMARMFSVGEPAEKTKQLVIAAERALDCGIRAMKSGSHLSDVSAAIQGEVEANGYGVVRDFAGHGIGKRMHEDPEVLNYGPPGRGPVMRSGMAFAIEPMITMGDYGVYVAQDGWTVRTEDGSMAAHVEDTVLLTEHGPKITTRSSECAALWGEQENV